MSTPDPTAASTAGSPVDVQAVVVHSADAADLFGSAPALLVDLQVAIGELAAAASRLTERGRRPFRPDDAWARALGEVAYRTYLLADQSGVPLDRHVLEVADTVLRGTQQRAAANPDPDDDWPLRS
ncbi:hypothetical protein ACXR2U_24010 [Jatrophihabitans sp. YIM 134969]